MKKLLFSVIIIIIIAGISINFINVSVVTPYSGRYVYSANNNISIILKSNNTFLLTFDAFKDEELSSGNYTITDNIINLNFKDNNLSPISRNLSLGKIEGSTIVFKELKGYLIKS